MAIRKDAQLIAVVLGTYLIHTGPVAAADLWVASQNSVTNNVEIDQFDSSGLFANGFYLHTSSGNVGAGYFSGFAFDPAGNLWVASKNNVANNVEIDKFNSSGLFTNGFYLHTSSGNLGAGYFTDFAFDPAGNLWVASINNVANNVEIDKFNSSGLFIDGFYLHTSSGTLGAGYFSGFAFDPAGNLWVASQNNVANNVEIDKFNSSGLFANGFYLHTSSGNVGAGYFAAFAFDPAGQLWVASQNSVSNNVELDKFDSSGLFGGGFYLHTSSGDLGAAYFSGFDFAASAAATAPEPASWAMMIIGFGAIGMTGWRRKAKTALAARLCKSPPGAGWEKVQSGFSQKIPRFRESRA